MTQVFSTTAAEPKRDLEAEDLAALNLLAKARVVVRRKGPYFMRTLLLLIPTPRHGMLERANGPLAVSHDLRLYYDPRALVEYPELGELDSGGLPQKLAGALVHECLHILHDMDRLVPLQRIDPVICNIAADMAINPDVREGGWELPTWVVYPEKYNLPEGKTLEWYFAELMKLKQQGLFESGELKIAAGACGSIAGNGMGEDEAPDGDGEGDQEGQEGEQPSQGRTRIERALAVRQTLKEAQEHLQNNPRSRGTLPGWMAEALQAYAHTKPSRDWEKELRHVVRRQAQLSVPGGSDFSLRWPSKRSILYGFPRPGLVDQQLDVAVFWDTSGSMSLADLNKARQVTCEVLAQLGLDSILLAQGDTRVVQDFKKTRLKDLRDIKVHGRGGTDFRPAFERVAKLRPKPSVIIFITDGEGPAPERPPPGIGVLWVLVPGRTCRPAPWGRYVVCSNDEAIVEQYER